MEVIHPRRCLLNSQNVPWRGYAFGEVKLFANDFLVVLCVIFPVINVLPCVNSDVHDVLEVLLLL